MPPAAGTRSRAALLLVGLHPHLPHHPPSRPSFPFPLSYYVHTSLAERTLRAPAKGSPRAGGRKTRSRQRQRRRRRGGSEPHPDPPPSAPARHAVASVRARSVGTLVALPLRHLASAFVPRYKAGRRERRRDGDIHQTPRKLIKSFVCRFSCCMRVFGRGENVVGLRRQMQRIGWMWMEGQTNSGNAQRAHVSIPSKDLVTSASLIKLDAPLPQA
jgi:hypothetical protein